MISFLLYVYVYFTGLTIDYPANLWTSKGNLDIQQIVYQKNINNLQEDWAKKNLQTGDIIYRSGDEIILFFNFSKYVRKITDSKYSHCGIVLRMLDRTWVFDTDRSGYRKVPFSIFMQESNGLILVQRLRPEYRQTIVPVMTYCFRQYMRNTPFDFEFDLTPDKLYCAEACVNAFKCGRLLLQEPVPVGDFPAIDKYILETLMVIGASYIINDRPFSLSQKMYHVKGISQSKYLQTVFQGRLQ